MPKPKWSDDRWLSDGSEFRFPGSPGYEKWCADLAKEQAEQRAAADARLAAKRAARTAGTPPPGRDDEPPPPLPARTMKRLVSDEQDVIATFRLRGDAVVIEENVRGAIGMFGLDMLPDPDLDHDIDEDELDANPGAGTLKPADGKRYWAALDRVFAHSSRCHIETVPDE